MMTLMAPNPASGHRILHRSRLTIFLNFRSCYCPRASDDQVAAPSGSIWFLLFDDRDDLLANIYVFFTPTSQHDYATWVYMHTNTWAVAEAAEDKSGRRVALLNHSSFSTHVRSRFVRPKYNGCIAAPSAPRTVRCSSASWVELSGDSESDHPLWTFPIRSFGCRIWFINSIFWKVVGRGQWTRSDDRPIAGRGI